tara:strand:+ start:512 stop:676 length:165 start_codon:yes stop_codon:yes gene_type:complete
MKDQISSKKDAGATGAADLALIVRMGLVSSPLPVSVRGWSGQALPWKSGIDSAT